MEADRNLRFGVLALQEKLIDANQFAEACAKWGQGTQQSLADVLVELGWIRPAAKARLEALIHVGPAAEPTATQWYFASDNPDPSATLDTAGVTLDASGLNSASQSSPVPLEVTRPELRYEVSRLYAEGGIGRIWLARDTQLNRQVALKTLRPELLGYPRVRERFLQEAQVTGQLEHPGVIPVYEVVPQPESGQVSYAMRFVRGKTLVKASTEYHEQRKCGTADPLGLVSLLSAFVAVCHTVAYAHSRGVVHRDLKGENVLLGDFGEVIVLDWGVAKVLNQPTETAGSEPPIEWLSSQVDQTLQGDVIGTPAYMAPEQAEGLADLIDCRTDLYGLGAILYEILTGQPPFTGSSTIEVLHKVVREDPARPSVLWSEVPPQLEAICLQALCKDPAGRFASASDLAEQVQTWQEVQRQEALHALRQQTAILQSILDNMAESVVLTDVDWKILLVNPAAQRMLGAVPGDTSLEQARQRCPVFLPDAVTPYPLEELPLSRALRGETVDDAELYVCPLDSSAGRWLSVAARPLETSGKITGALMVLRDITERKLAEVELRRSRERFELAVRGSQDGLWDWDVQTNEVFFSPRWKSILGYDDHEIAHHLDEWDRRLHPDERERVLAANYAHINGTTSHYEYEYRLRHKNGSFRWILARGVALRDDSGKAYRMAGSHVDITDWKQLEQELRESEERYRALVEDRARK